MKNLLILFILSSCAYCSHGQQHQLTGCPKIYHSWQEVMDSSFDGQIVKVSRSAFGGDVKVAYKNGTKNKISPSAVWGYRTKNDYPTRIFKGSDYMLIVTKPVCIYKHIEGRISSYGYYSTSLESPIYDIGHLKKTDPNTYNKLKQDKYLRRKIF